MYPSSLTRSGKYSFVALQTMYFPLSSGFATNLTTEEVHSAASLLWAESADPDEDTAVTSNSRLSMYQRKIGRGLEPWQRHSSVDSLPADKALLRSPVIVTARGGTAKLKVWIFAPKFCTLSFGRKKRDIGNELISFPFNCLMVAI